MIGFEAIGEIVGADYETIIIPEIEKIRKDGKEIRFLYHFGKEFEGIDLGAMVEDTLLGIQYFRHWEKVAIVSDNHWIIGSIKALGMLLPGHVKTFPDAELQKAIEWLKA